MCAVIDHLAGWLGDWRPAVMAGDVDDICENYWGSRRAQISNWRLRQKAVLLGFYYAVCPSPLRLSPCFSVSLSLTLCLYISFSVVLSLSFTISLSLSASVFVSFCLSLWLCVYLCVYLTVCASVPVSLCRFVSPLSVSLSLSFFPSMSLPLSFGHHWPSFNEYSAIMLTAYLKPQCVTFQLCTNLYNAAAQ